MTLGPKMQSKNCIPIIDQVIISINERFQQLLVLHYSNIFGFLYDTYKFKCVDGSLLAVTLYGFPDITHRY